MSMQLCRVAPIATLSPLIGVLEVPGRPYLRLPRTGAHSRREMTTSNALPSPVSNLPAMLDPDQLSAYLGVPRRTIDGWRSGRGDGPPFVKFGKTVRYPEHRLVAWLDAQMSDAS